MNDYVMSPKAVAIQTLYNAKRITLNGVRQAVVNKILTPEDFFHITGQEYTA